MQKEEVKAERAREPFIPLRFHLTTGKKFDVPFREVAHLLGYGVLVLIGLKKGTQRAKTFDRFAFEQIARIDHRPSNRRRKKAS
jgi:hypothetical protein